MSVQVKERKPKSAPLDDDLLEWFKEYVASFRFKVECTADCGFDAETLERIGRTGRAAPESIERIKALKLRQDEKS